VAARATSAARTTARRMAISRMGPWRGRIRSEDLLDKRRRRGVNKKPTGQIATSPPAAPAFAAKGRSKIVQGRPAGGSYPLLSFDAPRRTPSSPLRGDEAVAEPQTCSHRRGAATRRVPRGAWNDGPGPLCRYPCLPAWGRPAEREMPTAPTGRRIRVPPRRGGTACKCCRVVLGLPPQTILERPFGAGARRSRLGVVSDQRLDRERVGRLLQVVVEPGQEGQVFRVGPGEGGHRDQ